MLKNQMFYSEDTGVHQGAYRRHCANNFQPGTRNLWGSKQLVEIIDLDNYFRIEIPVLGFKRENIHISIQDQVLTVCCTQGNDCIEGTRKRSKRRIILPENADIDFATAEYREGILNIFVFKSSQPNHHRKVDVNVY